MKRGTCQFVHERRAFIDNIWRYRHSIFTMTGHCLKYEYAGTVGGVLWAFVPPLAYMAILCLVLSYGLKISLGSAPYAVAFAGGYTVWLLLVPALQFSANSVVSRPHLVKRVAFPLEILPVSAVLAASLPHLLITALVALACLLSGFGGYALPLLLYYFLCAMLLMLGLGIGLSALAVLFPDSRQMLGPATQLWFWLTPVAWMLPPLPFAGRVLSSLNPASYLVAGYRSALMPEAFPAPEALEAVAFWTVTVAALMIGGRTFQRSREAFFECL